jgi:hypothetical protein
VICCEYDKGEKCYGQLGNCQLVKKKFAAWFYVAVKCGPHCMNEEALVTVLRVRGNPGIVETA